MFWNLKQTGNPENILHKTYVQTETDSKVVIENLRVLTRPRTSNNFPSGNNKSYTAIKPKLLCCHTGMFTGLHAEAAVSAPIHLKGKKIPIINRSVILLEK